MPFYRVMFRTGGRVNFKWNHIFAVFATPEAVQDKADEIKRMGYPAVIVPVKSLDEIPALPTTFYLE